MANPFSFPIFKAFTTSGTLAPLSLGNLYTFEAGTSTPQAVYQDEALTTPHTNPVTLDANGEAIIYLGPNAYKMRLEDSEGNIQPGWPIDDITGAGSDIAAVYAAFADTSDAAKGDALVGVKQPWANSGARTQHDRNVDDVQATDAAGVYKDAATDSSAGLQAAITAMAGRHLTIPPGTYKISTGLTVPKDTWIHAYGATLDASAGHITMLTFADGGGILGATLIGAGNTTYDALGNGIVCRGTGNHPAAPTYVAGPTVRDCVIKSQGAYGVNVRYCNSPRVEHCTFKDIGYCGINSESSNDSHFDFNSIDSVTPGTSGNAYGIGFGRNMYTGVTLTSEPRSKGGTVLGNKISNIPIWEALDAHAGDGIVFSGNSVKNCLMGCALVPTHIGSAGDYACINCTISSNDFDVLYGNAAITISGAYDVTLVNAASSNRITGNRINGGGIAEDNSYGAVRLIGTRECVISSNNFENPKVFGICLQHDNSSFVIQGNTFLDAHDETVTVPSGIGVRGVSNSGFIGGNTFIKRNAALATFVSVNSVYFTTPLTGLNVTIDKNNLSGFATAGPFIANAGQTGIDVAASYTESGLSTVSIASGGASSLVDVTFSGVFPVAPKVVPVCYGSPLTGGTGSIFRVLAITETGFRAIAYSATGGNFTASGDMDFNWFASI